MKQEGVTEVIGKSGCGIDKVTIPLGTREEKKQMRHGQTAVVVENSKEQAMRKEHRHRTRQNQDTKREEN